MTDQSLIERNAAFAATFDHADLEIKPHLSTLIVGCVDSRVDPAHLLGLGPGDAVVMRNVGGRVTDEVIEHIKILEALGSMMMGVTMDVALIHHTGCGASLFTMPQVSEAFTEALQVESSVIESLAIVDRGDIINTDIERRLVSNRRGRPLSHRRAWESIAAGEVDLSNVSRYRNRGKVNRYEMSAADLAFVSEQEQAMVSGAVAANAFGELLQAVDAEADLYVSASLHSELGSLIAAVPDQLGGVILRVVPDDVWQHAESVASVQAEAGDRLAPRAAVALDLMESGDPRHSVAAERLIQARG